MEKIKNILNETFKLSEDNLKDFDIINDKINLSEKDLKLINYLIQNKLDFNSICAYLISEHNIENIDLNDKDILDLANNLKQISSSNYSFNKMEESELLRKQFIAMCKDIRAIIIKLCLVLFDAKNCKQPLSLQDRELMQTIRTIYAPLAERLGLNKMKSELEDLCLKNLDPEIYSELEHNVLLKKDEIFLKF